MDQRQAQLGRLPLIVKLMVVVAEEGFHCKSANLPNSVEKRAGSGLFTGGSRVSDLGPPHHTTHIHDETFQRRRLKLAVAWSPEALEVGNLLVPATGLQMRCDVALNPSCFCE